MTRRSKHTRDKEGRTGWGVVHLRGGEKQQPTGRVLEVQGKIRMESNTVRIQFTSGIARLKRKTNNYFQPGVCRRKRCEKNTLSMRRPPRSYYGWGREGPANRIPERDRLC